MRRHPGRTGSLIAGLLIAGLLIGVPCSPAAAPTPRARDRAPAPSPGPVSRGPGGGVLVTRGVPVGWTGGLMGLPDGDPQYPDAESVYGVSKGNRAVIAWTNRIQTIKSRRAVEANIATLQW